MMRKQVTAAPVNPFVYSRALAPHEAIARRQDVAVLVDRARGGHNVTLHAPRRFGKTTLLKQVVLAAEEHGMPGVLIDLSDVLSIADVAVRLRQAYRALPGGAREVIERELSTIGLSTPLGGFTAQRRPREEPIDALHTLLELPTRIAERKDARVLVVLDEFQALLDLKGLDGVFRSHLQHHDRVSYVFCGSEPSLLRALFEDRARPLYGQAELLRLGALDPGEAFDFVVARFRDTGRDSGSVVWDLIRDAQGHPQRLMLLAHLLWRHVADGRSASISDLRAVRDEAMRLMEEELRHLWMALTANERRVVAAVASGFSPYGALAAAVVGLATPSSAQRAVESLLGRAVLERTDVGNELRVVDPLLARWARRHGIARLQVFVVPRGGEFAVTVGPSLAFVRSTHRTLSAAEAAADEIVADADGAADVMVYATDDPNELPDWAVGLDS